MSRLLYLMRKVIAGGGYGMLYNWFCTQEQAVVEYGYLYNCYTARNTLISSSTEWVVPSRTTLISLNTYLGGDSVAGRKISEPNLLYWQTIDYADNLFKLNGRGSGQRDEATGNFTEILRRFSFWTSTTYFGAGQYFYSKYYTSNSANINGTNSIKNGYSIRLCRVASGISDGVEGLYIGNDLKPYKTIVINQIEYLSENLMETKLRDGSAIPEVTSNTAWAALTTGARCSYNNLESNAGTTKKLSSSDEWVVPTISQILSLISYVGGNTIAGGKLKEIGLTHWESPNIGATDDYYFSFVAGGSRGSTGFGEDLKYNGIIWSSTIEPTLLNGAYFLYISYDTAELPIDPATSSTDLYNGYSIRLCNPNTINTEGSVNLYTQNDGTVIPTIVINGVEWTMNLKETKWSDGTDIQNVTDNTAWSLLTKAACCDINNDPTKR